MAWSRIRCFQFGGVNRGVPKPDDGAGVLVYARVLQGGVFVALELIHGIVHQFAVEYTQAYEQAEVLES